MQLLLKKGTEVNSLVGGGTLQSASYRGHEKIVQLLLEKGANVNAQGRQYGNPLQAASYGGHDKIMQVLLEKGAKTNAQEGGSFGNPL